MEQAGHLAVECDATGDAQVPASRLTQGQSREVHCGFLEALLDGEREVAVTLSDLLARCPRWSKALDHLVTKEAAVAAATTENEIRIGAHHPRECVEENCAQ